RLEVYDNEEEYNDDLDIDLDELDQIEPLLLDQDGELLDEDREFQGSNLYEVVRRRLEIYDNEEEYTDNLDIDLDELDQNEPLLLDQDGEVIIFSPSSSPIPSYTPPPYNI
ncbi:hypothetical protein Bhyg_07578, partial [Pseudolycoriella hygida]